MWTVSSRDTNPSSNFCDCQCEFVKLHPGTSEISTVAAIAVGTFKLGIRNTMWHSATRKHLILYPQGDRSGLKKPKKD